MPTRQKNLDVEQTQAVENALWAALRALEEGASLAKRMAKSAGDRQNPRLAKRFAERAQTKMEQAGLLRKLLVEGQEVIPEEKTS